MKKKTRKSSKTKSEEQSEVDEVSYVVSKLRNLPTDELADLEIHDWYPDLPKVDSVLYKRRQHLSGYPR